MAKEIGGITLTALSNGAHFNFMQTTLDLADACEAVVNKLSDDIAVFKKAFAVEDDKLKTMRKSELTEQIAQNDAIRDGSYSGYKGYVKGLFSLPAGDMLTAAKRLWNHIESYNIVTTDQLDKQTGMMTNFIDDLEKKYAEEITTLGLSSLVTTMKTANDNVRELMKNRNIETGSKGVGATKAARAATDDAYRAFVKKVNALALLEGDTAYASFIDEMNSQIVHFKREALNQSVSSTTTTDGSTTTTEDDAPVVDGGGTVSEDDIPEVM